MAGKPLALILESTVEDDCPQVEIDELRENTEEIGAALEANGYRTHILPFSLDVEAMRREILRHKPEVTFNLVDSIEGKGCLVQIAPMLLEHLCMPFTGAGSLATTTSCNKLVAKQLLRSENIRTPNWLTEEEMLRRPALEAPYILKSITEHASFGIFADSIAADGATLEKRFRERKHKYGTDWFAEAFIDGREFNISVLQTVDGPRVLPCAEIVFTEDFPKDAPKIVDYAAKWHEESGECKGTVRCFNFSAPDEKLLARLRELSLQCWKLFGLNGYARVDFRVDAAGEPYVLEVNANPFLTANEGFGAAAAHAGMRFTEVIGHIVASAWTNRKLSRSEAA
jgi:D-alanine-D-alanine ligase